MSIYPKISYDKKAKENKKLHWIFNKTLGF